MKRLATIKVKVLMLAILNLCSVFRLLAEEAPYEMHELLLRYNLAAHVKISTHGDGYFRVKVIDVLDKRKSGIKSGDYLKVSYDFNMVCPPSFPIEYAKEHKEALAFLTYHKGKWHLTQGVIIFLKNQTATINFHEEGFQYKATLIAWKKSLKEYASHFSENPEGRLQLLLSKREFENKRLEALSQLQYVRFYQMGSQLLSQYQELKHIELHEPVEESIEELSKNEIHLFAHKMPISDSLMKEISNELNVILKSKYPDFYESGIKGRSYYQLTFERDGKISNVEILKAVAKEISQEIQAYFKVKNQWSPALNENKEPIRFKQGLVYQFGKSTRQE